jgi:hypothetical protein
MNNEVTWDELPIEIQKRMLECQVEQGNNKDETVFREYVWVGKHSGGFTWDKTDEGEDFWNDIIHNKNFNVFFERYPNNVIIQVPMTVFGHSFRGLYIGIINALTIDNDSYEVEEQRTFTFAPEIFPAVKLMFQRMFDVENVEIFII